MKYDVFISSSSLDYRHARRVHEFLISRGLKVFFSEVTLAELQDADYRNQIDTALDNTYHMVVVTSSGQNVRSKWVEAEWGLFVNEKRSGRKPGNIITILVDQTLPTDLPPSLRYYEAIPLDGPGLQKLASFLPQQSASTPQILPVRPDKRRKLMPVAIALAIIAIAVASGVFYLHDKSPDPNTNRPTATNSPSSPPSLAAQLPSQTTQPPAQPPVLSQSTTPPPAVDPPATAVPLGKGSAVIVTVDTRFTDNLGFGDSVPIGRTGKIVTIDDAHNRFDIQFDAPINRTGWISKDCVEDYNGIPPKN